MREAAFASARCAIRVSELEPTHNLISAKEFEGNCGKDTAIDGNCPDLDSNQDQRLRSAPGASRKVLPGQEVGDGPAPSCPNLAGNPAGRGKSDLSRVVDAWDELPLHIRTSILALVDAVKARE